MTKIFLVFGALSGAIAVMLGAFGAHGLRGKLAANLFGAFETGVQYQVYHSLALILVGILLHLYPASHLLKWSGSFFVVGIFLFSGSLYALAMTEIRLFGPITPIGGVAFILGWLTLAYALVKTA